MKSTTITNEQRQTLRDQVITVDQPGPVLRDFRVLLEFLGPDGVEAGGKHQLLPMRMIEEMDRFLSRSLRLELKRPQIRSHPYLQGLNLLLRASGLARVNGSGAKARLVLDPTLLEQWDRLNPTEQYFQLLEAWFRFDRAEMVGERGAFGGDLFWPCCQAWKLLPAKGFRLDPKKPSVNYVPGFYGDLYLLALMDLFGLLKVEQSPRPITPWRPARVEHTPFGDAFFTLTISSHLDPIFKDDPSELDEEGVDDPPEDEEGNSEEPAEHAPRFGAWQPVFRPYFPEWRENLELPQRKFQEGEFIFRVTLGKSWRRIAVPADATLGDLVDLILRSVKFDGDHLYEFRYRDHLGAEVAANHPAMDEGPWADEIAIGTLPIELGQEMRLTYDFGDNWKFAIKLERVEASDLKAKQPRILESHGEAPTQYPDWDD